jgi:hypothetical protein
MSARSSDDGIAGSSRRSLLEAPRFPGRNVRSERPDATPLHPEGQALQLPRRTPSSWANDRLVQTAARCRSISSPLTAMSAFPRRERLLEVDSSRSANGGVRLLTVLLLTFDRVIASQPTSRNRPGFRQLVDVNRFTITPQILEGTAMEASGIAALPDDPGVNAFTREVRPWRGTPPARWRARAARADATVVSRRDALRLAAHARRRRPGRRGAISGWRAPPKPLRSGAARANPQRIRTPSLPRRNRATTAERRRVPSALPSPG